MANQKNIDMFNKFNSVIDNLYSCTEREQIDSIFSEADIKDFKTRITLLDRCMGVSETYGTPEEDLTDEDEYNFECAVFVEGSWRMLS